MQAEKEERRDWNHGRSTYRERYTGSIPQEEFGRGCKMLGSMLLAAWCLMWAVETGLL